MNIFDEQTVIITAILIFVAVFGNTYWIAGMVSQ
jgi:hypothetical protein